MYHHCEHQEVTVVACPQSRLVLMDSSHCLIGFISPLICLISPLICLISSLICLISPLICLISPLICLVAGRCCHLGLHQVCKLVLLRVRYITPTDQGLHGLNMAPLYFVDHVLKVIYPTRQARLSYSSGRKSAQHNVHDG